MAHDGQGYRGAMLESRKPAQPGVPGGDKPPLGLDETFYMPAKSKLTTEEINPLEDPIAWRDSLTKSDLDRVATSLEKQLLLGRLATWHRKEGATLRSCWDTGSRQNREFPSYLGYLA